MFDRVSDLGNLTGGSGGGDADLGELPDLLREGEELCHVLANDGSIELTREGRTTTVEPNGGGRAYLLVTDERILYLLGDQPDDIDIDIEMTDYTGSHVRKGLLSSKIHVKTNEESVIFAPSEGDIEAVGEYIEGVASCWADMWAAINRARHRVAKFEEKARDGTWSDERFLNAKSHLSEARSCAGRHDEAPEEKIRRQVDEVETELQQRRVETWLDRAGDCYEAIPDALADGEYGKACDQYTETANALDNARGALQEVDEPSEDTHEHLETLESGLQSMGEEFLAESDTECEAALSAEDPAVEIEAWEDAFERYNAIVEAGWNGHAPVSNEALKLQLMWVTASLLDALGNHATVYEQRADDCDDTDEAEQYYENAQDWFDRAQEFATEHPERSPDEFAEAADRVEDKQLEASGWEFGNTA